MGKSRNRIGRRSRLGWLLALFLLIVPAPVVGGVEWTMQASDPDGVEWTQPEGGDRLLRGGRTLGDAESWIRSSDDDGSLPQLRGSEWT